MSTQTAQAIKGRYSPGTIDGGRAFVEWELKEGRFSMSGEVWDRQGGDITMGGQCIDEIAKAFPNDKKLQRMAAIWQRWHLNDMKAGSLRQESWLREHTKEAEAHRGDHYEWASAALTAAGLNPDSEYRYTGEGAANVSQPGGYKYGSAWVKDPLPASVVLEIQLWGQGGAAEPKPFADFINDRRITLILHEGGTKDNARQFRAVLKMGDHRLIIPQYHQGLGINGDPTAGDILRAVVLDAALVDGSSFEDFCANLGYDTDSRKAEKVYAACKREAADLMEFLGAEDYAFVTGS